LKRTIASAAIAVLALAGCTLPPCGGSCAGSQWKGKRIAVFGDSLTDPALRERWKNYWAYLPETLGVDVHVFGVNGQQWTALPRQIASAVSEMGDGVDAATVLLGTNDYIHNCPLGEWFDLETKTVDSWGTTYLREHRVLNCDTNTFRGRINVGLRALKTTFPDAQIIVLTPPHRAFFTCSPRNVQPEEDFPNDIGHYFEEYVEAIREGARLWSVPVIDLYAESSLCPRLPGQGRLFWNARTDRLHPNSEGHRRIADLMTYRMLALPAGFTTDKQR